jgi:hypothetical protein
VLVLHSEEDLRCSIERASICSTCYVCSGRKWRWCASRARATSSHDPARRSTA